VITMRVQGDREAIRILRSLPAKMQAAASRKALRAGGAMIRTRARELAPVGPHLNPRRKYPRLRASIKIKTIRTGRLWRWLQRIMVQVKVQHAAVQEYGAHRTQNIEGRAYLKGATNQLWRPAVEEIFRAWRRTLRNMRATGKA
jgi:hypothetical protein